MALAGQVGNAYWPDCSPAREEYVTNFRSLIAAMPMTKQGARAKHLGIPLSSLSNYWTGRRVPSEATLHAIYGAVRGSASGVPVRLDQLERLRKSAARRKVNLVASPQNSDIRAAERLSHLVSAPSSPCGAVSAQRPAHDRRNSQNGKAGETVGALLAAQSTGDRRGVIGIAWSASKALTDEELCDAAADLYASEHSSLGEVLLLGGRERGHEDTMRLAITLLRADLSDQAELVLRAALPQGGN
ncbi:hypothetical protein ACGFYU_25475 [Streptomyces sp. NPDC048337]|uniref:hypothetical protein n=1 Tax=Streptomyces sp. NPDC048337 TaxID=3365535 RepID=UPI003712CA30